MEYYDYSGIIHFHSDYSFDGRTALPEIIAAAKDNGLDFFDADGSLDAAGPQGRI